MWLEHVPTTGSVRAASPRSPRSPPKAGEEAPQGSPRHGAGTVPPRGAPAVRRGGEEAPQGSPDMGPAHVPPRGAPAVRRRRARRHRRVPQTWGRACASPRSPRSPPKAGEEAPQGSPDMGPVHAPDPRSGACTHRHGNPSTIAPVHDAVVIGSGHNGLVAAAYLARAGLDVAVFERNAVAGGAVASEELTEPGFVHDTFSSWHPLFKRSGHVRRARRRAGDRVRRDAARDDRERRERRARRDRLPRSRADRRGVRRRATATRTSREIDRFGATIDVVGRLLGAELHAPGAARLASAARAAAQTPRDARVRGRRRVLGAGLVRDALQRAPRSPTSTRRGRSMSASPPGGAGSGFQVLAIAGSLHGVGLPVVRGGSANFVRGVRAADRRARRHDRDGRRGVADRHGPRRGPSACSPAESATTCAAR